MVEIFDERCEWECSEKIQNIMSLGKAHLAEMNYDECINANKEAIKKLEELKKFKENERIRKLDQGLKEQKKLISGMLSQYHVNWDAVMNLALKGKQIQELILGLENGTEVPLPTE